MGVIPDEILTKMGKCFQCGLYLSILPIKIYADNAIKCGRCSSVEDVGTKSLLNKLAEKLKFPCINRYYGCSKILSPLTAPIHEEVCFKRAFACIYPGCPKVNKSMDSLTLTKHFETCHTHYILSSPTFKVTLEGAQEKTVVYVYKTANGFMFYLIFTCAANGDKFDMKVIPLTDFEPFTNLNYKFWLEPRHCRRTTLNDVEYTRSYEQFPNRNNRDWIQFTLPQLIVVDCLIDDSLFFVNQHVDLDSQRAMQVVNHKLHLTKQFKITFPHIKLSECETKLVVCNANGNVVYALKYCLNCSYLTVIEQDLSKITNIVLLNRICVFCSKSIGKYYEFYTEILQQLRFVCKWGCGQRFLCFALNNHENLCVKKCICKCCPFLCKNIVDQIFPNMEHHFNNYHRPCKLYSVDQFSSNLQSGEFYLLISKNIYLRLVQTIILPNKDGASGECRIMSEFINVDGVTNTESLCAIFTFTSKSHSNKQIVKTLGFFEYDVPFDAMNISIEPISNIANTYSNNISIPFVFTGQFGSADGTEGDEVNEPKSRSLAELIAVS